MSVNGRWNKGCYVLIWLLIFFLVLIKLLIFFLVLISLLNFLFLSTLISYSFFSSASFLPLRIRLLFCFCQEEKASPKWSSSLKGTGKIHRRRGGVAALLLSCGRKTGDSFSGARSIKSFLGRDTCSLHAIYDKSDFKRYHDIAQEYTTDHRSDILPYTQSNLHFCTENLYFTRSNPANTAPTTANQHSSPLYKPAFTPLINHQSHRRWVNSSRRISCC